MYTSSPISLPYETWSRKDFDLNQWKDQNGLPPETEVILKGQSQLSKDADAALSNSDFLEEIRLGNEIKNKTGKFPSQKYGHRWREKIESSFSSGSPENRE